MSGPPTNRLSTSAVAPTKQEGPSNSKRTETVPKSYDETNLPSYKDGITSEEENLKRSRTCRFIEEAGRILKLPRLAVATAMVLFHRFYAKHSFAEHDRFEVAVACILLAAKVEEAPKKLSTIIVECHALKCSGAARVGRSLPAPQSGIDGATKAELPFDTNSEEYSKLKERILLLERVVLHTIAFELSIDHPYKFVVDQVRKWCNLRKVEYEPNSEGAAAVVGASGVATANKMTNELVQYAMNYANDSLHTCLCLQYPAKQIALACAFMAAKFCNIRPVDSEGKGWLDLLDGMPVEILACTYFKSINYSVTATLRQNQFILSFSVTPFIFPILSYMPANNGFDIKEAKPQRYRRPRNNS
jgi:cyclin T